MATAMATAGQQFALGSCTQLLDLDQRPEDTYFKGSANCRRPSATLEAYSRCPSTAKTGSLLGISRRSSKRAAQVAYAHADLEGIGNRSCREAEARRNDCSFEISPSGNTRRTLLGGIVAAASFALLGSSASTAHAEVTMEAPGKQPGVDKWEEVDGDFGFDGEGRQPVEYAEGKVVALAQAGEGAVLFVGVDGFELPLRMAVGAAEAMAVLAAAQERHARRPVTHEAWGLTLAAVGWKVDRVAITSLDNEVFMSRVILSKQHSLGERVPSYLQDDPHAEEMVPASDTYQVQEEQTVRSVDVRPSDAIALGLRCGAPLFISKLVAEDVLTSKKQRKKIDPLERPGLLANAADSAADSAAVYVHNTHKDNAAAGVAGVYLQPEAFVRLDAPLGAAEEARVFGRLMRLSGFGNGGAVDALVEL
eukprot:jgi/Mesen1/6753/ME000344S06034